VVREERSILPPFGAEAALAMSVWSRTSLRG
jgi:hypothetical protein